MQKQASHFYEFGLFRVDAREHLLYRAGEAVPLSPKVFDTLLVLVENAGHVLGKNELMQRLWPESFVEESSLAQNISLLRKALGEGASERQYIETVPKRGYRFVAEVRETVRETAREETEEVAPPAPPPREQAPGGAHARVPRTSDVTPAEPARSGRRAYAVLASILLCSLVTGLLFARAC
jgi:DNA-binding winged helix-turn-helix (wHTH) protein